MSEESKKEDRPEKSSVFQEFVEDERMAHLEVVWAKETFAYEVLIRDLELVRRGVDDGGRLRPPETDHERVLLITHVRALANDLAKAWGFRHLVRPNDDTDREDQLIN
jgi:hypothetical protein